MKDQASSPEKSRVLFCIATHLLEVVFQDSVDWKQLLPSFMPFLYKQSGEMEAICSVNVTEQLIHIELSQAKVLEEIQGVVGHKFTLLENGHNYIADIQFIEGGNHYYMVTDKLFSTATIYIDRKEFFTGMILTSFLLIVFSQSAVLHNTLLLHASVVEKDGKGYAFLGKSGTGKSTHSSLWLRHIEGTELLNDDNPAVHIETDGSVNVYGTPWSGKTHCYKNRKVRLDAMIRLEQAACNRFTHVKDVEALITILPSCASMRWNTLLYNAMCSLFERIILKVKIGWLVCLPDKEAALMCYKSINKKEIK